MIIVSVDRGYRYEEIDQALIDAGSGMCIIGIS